MGENVQFIIMYRDTKFHKNLKNLIKIQKERRSSLINSLSPIVGYNSRRRESTRPSSPLFGKTWKMEYFIQVILIKNTFDKIDIKSFTNIISSTSWVPETFTMYVIINKI